MQLGKSKAHDWKIAKHYLDEQKNKTEAYVKRRANFYETAIVNNDSRPTCTFLSKNTYLQLFDESFKNFYTNIMQEIENFAARRIPLEYSQHFTVDIQNLYYFNDDCTGVRTRS